MSNSSWESKFGLLQGRPKYDNVGKLFVLKKYFGKSIMQDAKKPVAVTSYDIEKRKPVLIRSYSEDDSQIKIIDAANATSAAPIYFPTAKVEDRYLIDVTDYFMSDSPGFNIIRSYEKDNYKIGGVDKQRSYIDYTRSFPKNTEILHTLTFNVNNAPSQNRTKTFSFQINHSIIALPENQMPIRYKDDRVGWFSIEKINYSSDALKSDNYNIARRWRLEPSDVDAYLRGELVEPVKPIVYYLDPAMAEAHDALICIGAVSYTHLTLPTILLV